MRCFKYKSPKNTGAKHHIYIANSNYYVKEIMGHEEYYIIKKMDSVQMKLAACIPPPTTTTIVLATVAVTIAVRVTSTTMVLTVMIT